MRDCFLSKVSFRYEENSIHNNVVVLENGMKSHHMYHLNNKPLKAKATSTYVYSCNMGSCL